MGSRRSARVAAEAESLNRTLTLHVSLFHDFQIVHRIPVFEFSRDDVTEDLELSMRMFAETFRGLDSILRSQSYSNQPG